ncbi:hypothetical protein BU23DRAFT_557621 [Bimuria novae-zelandiae CBS 107.79]|uniref:Uncharacterized protein n=1 Tax=Bimuria novae-zelandiae CBS 107.79 TaxID=1447943 RepID=A0A6A5UX81_9PLEO|nr:hypothetical protein BU23DRAFT_557621 [Bimuria novae-zelandiae CBS 107.79]
MARRSRRLSTSRAVPAAVSTIATSRAKRQCRNNPPPLTAMLIYKNLYCLIVQEVTGLSLEN